MEADQTPTDEAEQAISSPEVDHDSNTTTAMRSYECTFCKRGFSNAQALGGHMNIHRKDRAKLKQPSSHAQFPFNIAPRGPLSYLPPRGFVFDQPRASPNWEQDGPRQLPLFVEKPSPPGQYIVRASGAIGPHQDETEQPKQAGLDLELRLGP